MAYRNPLPTVDIIIECQGGIVLIERKNQPFGWAIPGGFVDYGESLEMAAVREALEETTLDVHLKEQMQTFSDSSRDPRHHIVSAVFIVTSGGVPIARDDAKTTGIFTTDTLPTPIVFDHSRILADYFACKKGEARDKVCGIITVEDHHHEG